MKTAISSPLLKIAIGLSVSSALLAQVPTYTVSTLMGSYNTTDTSTNAPISSPYSVAVDSGGNVYFTDTIGNRVRRIDATTGAITTVVGDGTISSGTATMGAGGPATKAKLWQPTGLVFDTAGNMYISDGFNSTIDKVDTNGVLTVYAGTGARGYNGDGGAAVAAIIRNPQRLAMDAQGNLYIADKENNRIRKVTTDGVIHDIAGVGANSSLTAHAFTGDGGFAVEAGIGEPEAVAVDSNGNVYIADTGNNRIRMINVASKTGTPLTDSKGKALTDNTRIITTVAGGGAAAQVNLGLAPNPLIAILSAPAGLAIDANNNVYISDRGNNRILYLNNNFNTPCPAGSPASCVQSASLSIAVTGLNTPNGIALSGSKLYIAETGGNKISVFDVSANVYTVLAQAQTFPFAGPHGLAVNPTTGTVYVADTNNQRIGTVPKTGGSMTVIAGVTGNAGFPTSGGDEDPFNPVNAATSKVSSPWGGAFDNNGNYYFADKGNNRVRMISPAGIISTVAGGLATLIPTIIAPGAKGAVNVSVAAGYAGDGIPAVEGQLRSPSAVAVDNVGGTNACATAPCIYIADTSNNTIRCVGCLNPGVMSTTAGTAPACAGGVATCAAVAAGAFGDGQLATEATLSGPQGVAVDSAGNVYIADTGNHMIRVVNSTTGIMTTFIGSGYGEASHSADGLAGPAQGNDSPISIAVGPDGSVYYAEGCITQNNWGTCENSRVRRSDVKTGLVATISAGVSLASLAGGSFADGIAGTKALALVPTAVAVGPDGAVYFTDATNRLRKLTPSK